LERFSSLLDEPVASTATTAAIDYLRVLFRAPASVGTRLAVGGLDGVVPRERVEVVCTAFAQEVLARLG